MEAAAEGFEEPEAAEVEPFADEDAVEEVAMETASAPSTLVADLAPDFSEAVASLAETTASVESNGSTAVAEPGTADGGSPLKREPLSPPWQPTRRRLRFWWLRRLVPSSGRSVSEPLRHDHAEARTTDTEAVAAAHLTPTLSSHVQRSEEAPKRLPDAEAPWRRMLPPSRPPLLLPRTGADNALPGDPLAV